MKTMRKMDQIRAKIRINIGATANILFLSTMSISELHMSSSELKKILGKLNSFARKTVACELTNIFNELKMFVGQTIVFLPFMLLSEPRNIFNELPNIFSELKMFVGELFLSQYIDKL